VSLEGGTGRRVSRGTPQLHATSASIKKNISVHRQYVSGAETTLYYYSIHLYILEKQCYFHLFCMVYNGFGLGHGCIFIRTSNRSLSHRERYHSIFSPSRDQVRIASTISVGVCNIQSVYLQFISPCLLFMHFVWILICLLCRSDDGRGVSGSSEKEEEDDDDDCTARLTANDCNISPPKNTARRLVMHVPLVSIVAECYDPSHRQHAPSYYSIPPYEY
jgi:hypothetical protein